MSWKKTNTWLFRNTYISYYYKDHKWDRNLRVMLLCEWCCWGLSRDAYARSHTAAEACTHSGWLQGVARVWACSMWMMTTACSAISLDGSRGKASSLYNMHNNRARRPQCEAAAMDTWQRDSTLASSKRTGFVFRCNLKKVKTLERSNVVHQAGFCQLLSAC